MRIWDIVDNDSSDVEFTKVRSARGRLKGVISSTIRFAFVMGMVVSNSSHIRTSREDFASNSVIRYQKTTDKGVETIPHSRRTRVRSSTDTQFGQSTSRLANTFPAFFQPAPDEDEFDIDYSFS